MLDRPFRWTPAINRRPLLCVLNVFRRRLSEKILEDWPRSTRVPDRWLWVPYFALDGHADAVADLLGQRRLRRSIYTF